MPLTSSQICLVSPLPPPMGGIAKWTLLMHSAASTAGGVTLRQVDIAPRWRGIADLGRAKRMLGGSAQLLRDCPKLISILRDRPEVMHLTSSGQLAAVRDIVMLRLAKVYQIPTVYHLHFGRIPEIASANTLEWRLLAHAIRLSDVVLGVTPATAETICKHMPGANVAYVPNPIDFEDLSSHSACVSQRQTVLFLSWCIPTKGIEDLVKAWIALDTSGWELQIAGPIEATYKDYLVEKYKPQDAHFLGELEHTEAMRLMAEAGLFVLPSHTEGFPNVILEAMALGKAIIATSVGAIPDMLTGECGVLVPPQDPDELQVELVRLMSNPAQRAKLGNNAYAKVTRNYTLDRVFAQYTNYWHSIINK